MDQQPWSFFGSRCILKCTVMRSSGTLILKYMTEIRNKNMQIFTKYSRIWRTEILSVHFILILTMKVFWQRLVDFLRVKGVKKESLSFYMEAGFFTRVTQPFRPKIRRQTIIYYSTVRFLVSTKLFFHFLAFISKYIYRFFVGFIWKTIIVANIKVLYLIVLQMCYTKHLIQYYRRINYNYYICILIETWNYICSNLALTTYVLYLFVLTPSAYFISSSITWLIVTLIFWKIYRI